MNDRELFLYELEGRGYTFENMRWLGNCFEDNFLNMAWEMWQASANREGYKLMPVEMHWHKADDLASAEWDKHKDLFCSTNRDMTAMQVEEFRLRWCGNKAHQIMNNYKAMINSIELK